MKPLRDWPKYCNHCGAKLDYYLDVTGFNVTTGKKQFDVRASCSVKRSNLDKFLDGFLLRMGHHTKEQYCDWAEEGDNGVVSVRVPFEGTIKWGTAVPRSNK